MKNKQENKDQKKETGLSVRSSKGSVLMEYVLVQVLVACLLMAVMNALFYNWGTAEFGPAGMGIKYFYQRLLGGFSLPVP